MSAEITTVEGIDNAIVRLESELANLRKARGLVAERERLRADLARLDQSISGVIAGAKPTSAPPLRTVEPNKGGRGEIATTPPDGKRRPGKPPIMIPFNGRTLTLEQWSAETGIRVETLRYRFNAGWAPARALGGALHTRGAAAADVDADGGGSTREPAEIDIDAKAAGATSGPALQKQLDEMEGRPTVLPPGMAFRFDPKAPAASVPALKIETARRQKGGKSREVEFVTTASRGHVHVAVVDHFGDGQTKVDSTGHVHRLARWQMIEAHKHEHGLAMTGRAS